MCMRKAGLEELIMIVGHNMFLITLPTLQQANGPLHDVSACLDAAFGTDKLAYARVKLCFSI